MNMHFFWHVFVSNVAFKVASSFFGRGVLDMITVWIALGPSSSDFCLERVHSEVCDTLISVISINCV
jgi:hypothetical protein